MDNTGKSLHSLAESAREAGHFSEALRYTDEAFLAYQKEKNVLGMSEILSSRSIALRHLWQRTSDRSYLILAKHEIMAAVELAREFGDESVVVMPMFSFGKVQEELGEIKEACHSYAKAIELFKKNPPESHNRPAVLLDMESHLYICEYKNGDNSALEKAVNALQILEKTDEWQYNKDVWVSGGYMKLASFVYEKDKKKGKDYFEKAKKIIDGNKELTLRKEQLQKIALRFNE